MDMAGTDEEDRPVPAAAGGDTLGKLAFFRGADPAALAEAAPSARWISVGAGELLVDFGDQTDDVFLVAEGAVRVVVRTPLGQEVILGDLEAGDIFGEMASIDGAPRSANVSEIGRASCRGKSVDLGGRRIIKK